MHTTQKPGSIVGTGSAQLYQISFPISACSQHRLPYKLLICIAPIDEAASNAAISRSDHYITVLLLGTGRCVPDLGLLLSRMHASKS